MAHDRHIESREPTLGVSGVSGDSGADGAELRALPIALLPRIPGDERQDALGLLPGTPLGNAPRAGDSAADLGDSRSRVQEERIEAWRPRRIDSPHSSAAIAHGHESPPDSPQPEPQYNAAAARDAGRRFSPHSSIAPTTSLASLVHRINGHIPAKERIVVLGLLFVVFAWILSICALMKLLSYFYFVGAVDSERGRQVVSEASRSGAEAAALLSGALSARDAVHYAVSRRLYFDPLDYDTLYQILMPVFVATPALRAVDLAFTDRPASITMRRRWQHGDMEESDVVLQSDAFDCKRLGAVGCLRRSPARQQAWYHIGFAIESHEESVLPTQHQGSGIFLPNNLTRAFQSNASSTESPRNPKASAHLSGVRWADGLVFIQDHGVTSATADWRYGGSAVAWAPACLLVFRVVVPGTGGRLSIIGRVTLEVGALRQLLVGAGTVYMCDRSGALLGATELGTQLRLVEGRPTVRRIWQTEAWARSLQAQLEDVAARGAPAQFVADGFHVVVAPVPGRGLGHFFVVASVAQMPFVHSGLAGLAAAMDTLMCVPFGTGLVVLAGYLFHRELHHRRNARREIVKLEGKAYISRVNEINTMNRAKIGTSVGILRKNGRVRT